MFKMLSFFKRIRCLAKTAYVLPVTLNFTNTNLVELALLASDDERELLLAEEYRITAVLRLPAPIFAKGKQPGLVDFKFQVLGTPKSRTIKVQILHAGIDRPLSLPLTQGTTHEYYLSFPITTERRGGATLNVDILIDPIGD